MQLYGLTLSAYAVKYSLDAKVLNLILQSFNQSLQDEMTPEQEFVLEAIKLAKISDIPGKAAIELVKNRYKQTNKPIPEMDPYRLWTKVETYYWHKHHDMAKDRPSMHLADIFNQQYPGEFERRTGIQFDITNSMYKIIIARAIRRKLDKIGLDPDYIPDYAILDIIAGEEEDIWFELNADKPEENKS